MLARCDALRASLAAAVTDDLSVVHFWPELFAFCRFANGLLALGRLGPADAGCLAQAVTDVDGVLGLLDPADLPLPRRDWPSEAARLVAERHKARAAKDFPLADRLRADIARLGYRVEDTVDGCRLYPVT